MPDKRFLKFKTGVIGGSFNPFHLGHLNSLITVREKFALGRILVIPSYQTPLKRESTVSPAHRWEMLKKSLSSYPFIKLDDQEIRRKGMSYSHQSITQLAKDRDKQELFFIMGLDQFFLFDLWKHFTEILKKANLIVTSRQSLSFPKKPSDFPEGLRPLIKNRLPKEISLKSSEKKIYFCPLKDMDIDSSHIRQRLREGKEVNHLIPKEVDSYIKEKGLYTKGKKEIKDPTQELINFSLKELKKKKAGSVQFFDLRSKPLPFSFGLIVSGSNTRQTRTLSVYIRKKIKERFGLLPINEEGQGEALWIALDYGDLLIHIFQDYTKNFYKLEEIWKSPLPMEKERNKDPV